MTFNNSELQLQCATKAAGGATNHQSHNRLNIKQFSA